MELLPADYVVGGLVVVMAVLGLFRGASGTLAFFVACVCAALTVSLCWPLSESVTPVTWMRVAGTLLVTLIAFGVVRMLVKRFVNGLLAQPTDAILGFVMGAIMGALVLVGWGYSGWHLEYSNLAAKAAEVIASVPSGK